MTPAELDAIRARDAMDPRIVPDRGALLRYVDELLKFAQGVASCSTCGACRGAAQKLLIEPTMPPNERETLGGFNVLNR